ncbi:MAG: hypothetical protein WKG07_27110 [Hymenobacter sp.]
MAFLRELFQKNFSTFLTMGLLLAVPLLGSAAVLGLLYERPTLLQHLSLAQSLLYFVLAGLTMALALTPTTFVAIISGLLFGWAGLPGMVAAYAWPPRWATSWPAASTTASCAPCSTTSPRPRLC